MFFFIFFCVALGQCPSLAGIIILYCTITRPTATTKYNRQTLAWSGQA